MLKALFYTKKNKFRLYIPLALAMLALLSIALHFVPISSKETSGCVNGQVCAGVCSAFADANGHTLSNKRNYRVINGKLSTYKNLTPKQGCSVETSKLYLL